MEATDLANLVRIRNLLSGFCADFSDSLCIDAFPRCANTYSTYLSGLILYFQQADCFDVDMLAEGYNPGHGLHLNISANVIEKRFIHHQHDPVFTRKLIESGVSTITVIREPFAAFESVIRYYSSDPEMAVKTACTYNDWLDLVLEMQDKDNFKPLLFDKLCAEPPIIARALCDLGLIKDCPNSQQISIFSDYVKSMILEVDQDQHGKNYDQRCAIPLPRKQNVCVEDILGGYIDLDVFLSRYNEVRECLLAVP